MKRYYLYFAFTLTTVAFITQGATQVPTDATTESLPLTDYFNQVTLFSDGKITRFTRMPIRVYISPTLKAHPYFAEIRYAMHTWESAPNGKIRFQETESLEQADINVIATRSGRMSFLDTRLGSAELTRLDQTTYTISDTDAGGQGNNTPQSSDRAVGFTVEVILVLEGDGTTSELTQEEMRTEPSILRKRGNSP